jgi:thymidine kinase
MTPREKAEHILDKCYELELETVYYGVNHYLAKKFAMILIDECIQFENKIVQEVETLAKEAKREFRCDGLFWNEVKNELQNIDAEYKKADKLAFESMNKKKKQ